MRPINDAHVAEPGLAVVEIAAADDATAFAVQQMLAARIRHRRGVLLPWVCDARRAPVGLDAFQWSIRMW